MNTLKQLTIITGIIALFFLIPTITYIYGVAITRSTAHCDVLPTDRDNRLAQNLDSLHQATRAEVAGAYAVASTVMPEVDHRVRVIRGDTLDGFPHPVKIEAMEAGIDPLEVLWLGRTILSETNRPGAEMEHVAWTIRNRVDTHYRGQRTYRGVVLDRYQFSAFNNGGGQVYKRLTWGDARSLNHANFQAALRTAIKIMKADVSTRPFARTVRHYYSPVSMKPVNSKPMWYVDVTSGRAQRVARYLDANRFRFYDRVR